MKIFLMLVLAAWLSGCADGQTGDPTGGGGSGAAGEWLGSSAAGTEGGAGGSHDGAAGSASLPACQLPVGSYSACPAPPPEDPNAPVTKVLAVDCAQVKYVVDDLLPAGPLKKVIVPEGDCSYRANAQSWTIVCLDSCP